MSPVEALKREGGLNGKLTYDKTTAFGYGVEIDASADVTIGESTMLGRYSCIITHYHADLGIGGGSHAPVAAPLTIGAHVFIGDRAIILPQVSRIEDYATIGAGSVLTKDVGYGEVWAGNPARYIGQRKEKP